MNDGVFKYDVVVVGAGPAGLAAASVAAESGCHVVLVEASPWLGGQIWRGGPEFCRRGASENTKAHARANGTLPRQAERWLARFKGSGASVLDCTTVIASPRTGALLAERENAPR